MKHIYCDHVAANPLNPEVLEAMIPYFKEEFGNPMSVYPLGAHAKIAIEEARQKVAELINARSSEIIFTSSGAESNNFALRGIAIARKREGQHIITTRMDHHSITNTCRFLEKSDYTVSYVNPDSYGFIAPENIRKIMMDKTILISVIHASPEVGTIEPIKEIAQLAHEKSVVFHTDAIDAVGNIPVDVKDMGVDLLSLSAHQFYGPKGAAALYVKEGTRIVPLIYGGIQEGGRRAGTENVPAIVGMGKAAELAKRDLDKRINHVRKLRDKVITAFTQIDGVVLTGHPEKRLPAHISLTVKNIEGEGMLLLLGGHGISAASGSACTSKALKASPVLLSMGIDAQLAHGSVVFTFGMNNTEEDIDYLIQVFPTIIKKLRDISPLT
jgi:cysteine desulfurase